MTTAEPTLVLATCTVDLQRGLVQRPDGTERLTTREQTLLAYLAERPGQDVSRDDLLTAVWEYAPRSVTRAIDAVVYRLRRKIEADPADPMHLLTVVGVGYRFVPPAAPKATPRPAIPAPASAFVGRTEALAAVDAALSSRRLVTLHGPGGVGKTRLVLEYARRLPEDRAVRLVELQTATDAAEALPLIAAALGLPEDAGAVAIGQHLASRGPLLLILDNLEQLAADLSHTLERWLLHAPHTRWLCTSRAALRIDGEVVIPLPPLPEADGVALFCAHSTERGSPVSAGEDVAALVGLLDGLPLAIKLAAAWSGILPPAALKARLERGPLQGEAGRTLTDTVAWSWSLLTEPERAALARCATFVRPFGLEDAEALLGEGTLPLLRRLLDQALLRRIDDTPRFVLHRSVFAFAAARLAERSDHAEALRAHAAWFADRIEALGEPRQLDAAGLRALSALLPDGAAAIERVDDPVLVARLAVRVFRMLRFRGPQDRYRAIVHRAVAIRAGAPPLLAAQILAEWALMDSEDVPTARVRLEEAIALTEAAGADAQTAMYQNYLAAIIRFVDPVEEARLLQIALGHHRRIGTDALLRTTLLNLSNSARFLGRYEQALAWLEEADALPGAGPRARVSALSNRARLRQALGMPGAPTCALLQEAAALCREQGDARFESRVHIVWAGILADQGQPAEERLAATAPLVETAGFDDMRAELAVATGQVRLSEGRWAEAAAAFADARDQCAAMNAAAMVGYAQTGLGVAAALRGTLLAAERSLSAAASVGKGAVRDARTLGFLALVRHRLGDAAGAQAILAQPPLAAAHTAVWSLCVAAIAGDASAAITAATTPAASDRSAPADCSVWVKAAVALVRQTPPAHTAPAMPRPPR